MFGANKVGWIGYDVGAASVKAAQAVRIGDERRIRAAGIVPRREPWSPSTLSDEPQSSLDELHAVESICDRLTGVSAAAVLPMAVCSSVQVAAPEARRPGDADLAAVVAAELHQSMDAHVLGAWPASLASGKTNVVAAPLAWSDQVSADVRRLRRNCRVIDSLPWALARAVDLVEGAEPPRTVAALDWGHARATLCLIHEGAPAMVRCLKDCALEGVIAAVESQLHMTAYDVQRLIFPRTCSTGASDSSSPSLLDSVLAEPLERLERELRRTLSFWQGQTRGSRPAALYLFGGGASIEGLDRRLEQSLELETLRWSMPFADPADAERLPAAHLLGPAVAASALAWEEL